MPSGLSCQVFQISENYFKFEVIKDINVLILGEINVSERAINICIKNNGILKEGNSFDENDPWMLQNKRPYQLYENCGRY